MTGKPGPPGALGVSAPRVSSLPSFSEDWVGGDIHGLSALAGTLYGYLPQMDGVVGALNAKVAALAGDAGWSGPAASAFAKRWDSDALAGSALGVVCAQVGGIADTLAVRLAGIEQGLESAADQARAARVPIGGDGRPVTFYGPPAGAAETARFQAAGQYAQIWQQAMASARQARTDAAAGLEAVYEQISPDGKLTRSQDITVADLLRGLWTRPTAYRSLLAGQLAQLRANAVAAKHAVKAARAAGDGLDEAKAARSAAVDARDAARGKLAGAQELEGKVPGSKLLGTGVGDVWDGAPKVLQDAPVLGGALAGAGAVVDSYEDIKDGKAWYEAIPEDVTSNAAGFGAGVLADGTIASVAGGLAIAGAPEAGVAVGFAAGAVLAVGVGDFVRAGFQEHWGADIDQYGVVGGIGHGTADIFDKTRHDMASMADGIGHAAGNLWDRIF